MSTRAPGKYEIAVEDVEYLRHGDRPLLARVYKPLGTGPFPLVVELHGGAWVHEDRRGDEILNEPLARSGVVVAALDFRMPPEAPYPASIADINYGIRWFKSRARAFDARPERVGIMGASSGGHQAMLVAMRPNDPRYAALPLREGAPAVDARVGCVVLCWPVIDPLGRYQVAKRLQAGGKPYPDFADRVIPSHDAFWQTEEAMAEGSPVRALERGESVEMPPAIYLQGAEDLAHPRPNLDRFVELYRAAGGQVQLELFEGEGQGFIRTSKSGAAERAMEKIAEFVHQQLG
jgi:acetyl esterase